MVRKCLLLCLFFSIGYVRLNSQTLTLDKYANQLFFKIFKEPDPAISDFINQYIPSLNYQKNKEGVAPSIPLLSEQNKFGEIHTFVFTKHPFLKISFTMGKLEFFCQRNTDMKDGKLTNLKFWLEFDTQQEAEMAFSNMIETCIPISTQKKFSSAIGSQKAEFSDAKETNGFGKIRIRLTTDNLGRHAFKVLVETGNDL